MSQVTIYLDEETDRKMQQAVKQSGLSKSQWISRLIREKTVTEWPQEVRELAGSWGLDDISQEDIRAAEGEDLSREPL